MTQYLSISHRPIAKGSYKQVFNAVPTNMIEPFIFTTPPNKKFENLVIILIPTKSDRDVIDDVYDEYALHHKFAERGLAPKFYGFTLVHKELQRQMIRLTPEKVFEAGSFQGALIQYFDKYPQLKDAIKNVYGIAILEERCASIKWQTYANAERMPDIVFGITELFDAVVDMGYVFLDTKLINLCPNAGLTKFQAIDFDTKFAKPFELFFDAKSAFIFMAIMIYTDMMKYFNEEMRYASKQCWKSVFELKNITQDDVIHMVEKCYQTACVDTLPEDELEYNPLNMIYYYRIDSDPNGNNRFIRNCRHMRLGIKTQILDYVLYMTEPLLPEPVFTEPELPSASASASESKSELPPGIREIIEGGRGGRRKKRRATKKRKH